MSTSRPALRFPLYSSLFENVKILETCKKNITNTFPQAFCDILLTFTLRGSISFSLPPTIAVDRRETVISDSCATHAYDVITDIDFHLFRDRNLAGRYSQVRQERERERECIRKDGRGEKTRSRGERTVSLKLRRIRQGKCIDSRVHRAQINAANRLSAAAFDSPRAINCN